MCNSDDCKFTDDSRAIGPNGANLTGGGTGGSASESQTSDPYVPFNGDLPRLPEGFGIAIGAGIVGMLLGGLSVMGRL